MPLQIPNYTAPTIVILLIAFVIGIVFGLFALLPSLLSAKSANRKLQKIIDKTMNLANSGNSTDDNLEKIENKK